MLLSFSWLALCYFLLTSHQEYSFSLLFLLLSVAFLLTLARPVQSDKAFSLWKLVDAIHLFLEFDSEGSRRKCLLTRLHSRFWCDTASASGDSARPRYPSFKWNRCVSNSAELHFLYEPAIVRRNEKYLISSSANVVLVACLRYLHFHYAGQSILLLTCPLCSSYVRILFLV